MKRKTETASLLVKQIDKNENIIGYGSEIGAFLRLDDLQPGYAFGQMDRAIIMSPNLTNSRIIIPVNSFENIIIYGFRICSASSDKKLFP